MLKIKESKLDKFHKIWNKLGFTLTRLESTYERLWYIKKGKIGSCRIDSKTGVIDFESSIPLKEQLYLIRPLRFKFMIEKVR
jgi:hypothetical protein